MFKFFMEEANGVTGGSGGGGGVQTQSTATQAATGGQGNNGQGAVQQSVGNGGSGSGTGGGDGKSWLESLPDDIKSDPSLQMFKEPGALAKSWVNAQKMMGADKVILPNDKSTDEEWTAFYQKMGRPDAADKYEIKGPDGKPVESEITKGFKETAFKLGLSPKQVAGLAEWNMGALSAAQEQQKNAELNQVKDSIKAYVEKVGGDDKYKARVDEARVAVRALASPELSKFLKDTGLGSRPEMIDFFAELKGMMSEDKIRDGTGIPLAGEDPAVLQREIDEIQDGKSPLWDMNHPNHSTYVQRRSKLYERLSAAQTRPNG
jgi:hypothetical protein